MYEINKNIICQVSFAFIFISSVNVYADNLKVVSAQDLNKYWVSEYRTPPRYPINALKEKIEGYVEVEFQINMDGTVGNVAVLKSEPIDIFDKTAIHTIKQWKFKPSNSIATTEPIMVNQVLKFNIKN